MISTSLSFKGVFFFACLGVFICKSAYAFGVNYAISSQDSLKERYNYTDEYTSQLDSLEEVDNIGFLTFLKQLKKQYQEQKNWEGLVHVITELAIDDYVSSQFDSAITKLDEAIEIGNTNLHRRHPAIAKANYYKGQSFFYKGDATAALKYGNIALEIFQINNRDSKSLDLSIALRGLGNVYQYLLADYFKAEQMYKKAVEILEFTSTDKQKETKFRLYYNLGVCNFEKFDFEKALTYSNRALSILENKKSETLEICLALKANTLIELERVDEAMLVLERTISLNKKLNDRPNSLLIQHLSNLGYAYLELKDYDKAEKSLKKCLLEGEYLEDDSNINFSYVYDNLGKLAKEKGEFKSAINYVEKSLNIRQELFGEKHPLVGQSLKSLGSTYLENEVYDSALHNFHKAIIATIPNYQDSIVINYPSLVQLKQNIQVLELITLKAESLVKLYAVENKKSFLKSALQGYNLADSLVSFYQDIYSRESTKLRFLALYHNFYERGIETAFTLYNHEKDFGYLENAFYLMEHSKAKLLMGSFKKAQIENQLGVPDSLLEKERNINQQIAYYQQEINIVGFQERLFELDKEKEQLNNYLKHNFPVYHAEKFKEESFSISQLQSFLAAGNQQLYSYYLGKDFLYKAVVSKDTFYINKRINDVQPQIVDVYDYLKNGFMLGGKTSSFKDFVIKNNQISKALLGNDVESEWIKTKNIIISTDFMLSYIPFEILFTQEHNVSERIDYRSLPYLVKKHNVQYVHNAFSLLQKKFNSQKITANPQVLAMSFSDHQEEEKSVSVTRKMMAKIPGAPLELDAINSFFKGSFFYGAEANESNFKKNASKHDILHLAVHGTANPNDTYGAYLQFRPDLELDNDGRFYNYELYNLKLQATLAVLSACESGMGKMNRGEGLLSIGRGFSYAGCPTTMMSLWQVNDNATAAIISDFYQELGVGYTVKEALRLAKVNYIKKSDELTAHPAYWAPMVNYGIDSRIERANNFAWLKYTFLLVILVVLGVLLKKHLPLGSR